MVDGLQFSPRAPLGRFCALPGTRLRANGAGDAHTLTYLTVLCEPVRLSFLFLSRSSITFWTVCLGSPVLLATSRGVMTSGPSAARTCLAESTYRCREPWLPL